MNLFENYKNVIKKAVENDPTKSNKIYGLSEPMLENNREYLKSLRNELPGQELSSEMKFLRKEWVYKTLLTTNHWEAIQILHT